MYVNTIDPRSDSEVTIGDDADSLRWHASPQHGVFLAGVAHTNDGVTVCQAELQHLPQNSVSRRLYWTNTSNGLSTRGSFTNIVSLIGQRS